MNALWVNNTDEITITATNSVTDQGYLLSAIYHGQEYPMVESPVGSGSWGVLIPVGVDLGDNAGRVYVISYDPNNQNVLQDQKFQDL